MPIETFITNVISNLPNFAIAVVVLYWQEKRIEKLLEVQAKLIDQLLDMADARDDAVKDVRSLVGRIVHDSAVSQTRRAQSAPPRKFEGD